MIPETREETQSVTSHSPLTPHALDPSGIRPPNRDQSSTGVQIPKQERKLGTTGRTHHPLWRLYVVSVLDEGRIPWSAASSIQQISPNGRPETTRKCGTCDDARELERMCELGDLFDGFVGACMVQLGILIRWPSGGLHKKRRESA